MTILILGAGNDEHAVHMRDALRTRGADAIHIDAAAFPTSMTISFDPVEQTGEIVSACGRQIAFDTVSACTGETTTASRRPICRTSGRP